MSAISCVAPPSVVCSMLRHMCSTRCSTCGRVRQLRLRWLWVTWGRSSFDVHRDRRGPTIWLNIGGRKPLAHLPRWRRRLLHLPAIRWRLR